MKLGSGIFWIAAIYGAFVLLAGLLGEAQFNIASPPAVTHPEFYYGFHSLALVFQIIFVIIACDPLRYRLLIPVAILEKAAFFIPCLVLWQNGRLNSSSSIFVGAMIDGLFILLFAYAWIATKYVNRDHSPQQRDP